MKNSTVIASPSFIITTIVYALLSSIFFEMDNIAFGEETTKFVVDNSLYTHQQIVEVEKECKSPCPESSEMCIQMCA